MGICYQCVNSFFNDSLEELGVGGGEELVLVPLRPQHGERVGVEVAVSRRRSSREGRPAGLQTCGGGAAGGRRPHGGHPRGGGPRSEAARGGGLGGALATHSEIVSQSVDFFQALKEESLFITCLSL